ncbi:hypothetical protein [Methylibium petroleiphilum]|uniref:hypothetical protein n=1 Tax=Methylibium petroleiphilum TaxID=105560 RepID=UPI0003F929C9|nr:hypothetical protein [Methylibium petroleiphilum]
MRVSLGLVLCAAALLLALPVIRPMFAELEATERDCVRTPPERRTESQRARCKPQGPAGLIIPGVL